MPQIQLPAPDPLAASGLLEDLQTAGLPVTAVTPVPGTSPPVVVIDGTFTLADADDIVAIVQAHDGQPTEEEATDSDAQSKIDAAVAKARLVWRGEASYTNAEAQKTLAGVVLYVTR